VWTVNSKKPQSAVKVTAAAKMAWLQLFVKWDTVTGYIPHRSFDLLMMYNCTFSQNVTIAILYFLLGHKSAMRKHATWTKKITSSHAKVEDSATRKVCCTDSISKWPKHACLHIDKTFMSVIVTLMYTKQ